MEIHLSPLYIFEDDINEMANDALQIQLFDKDYSETWYGYADRAVVEWFKDKGYEELLEYTVYNDVEALVEQVAYRAKKLYEEEEE